MGPNVLPSNTRPFWLVLWPLNANLPRPSTKNIETRKQHVRTWRMKTNVSQDKRFSNDFSGGSREGARGTHPPLFLDQT